MRIRVIGEQSVNRSAVFLRELLGDEKELGQMTALDEQRNRLPWRSNRILLHHVFFKALERVVTSSFWWSWAAVNSSLRQTSRYNWLIWFPRASHS